MNPKEIGKFLKQLRNERGMTQEQLAEVLGVSGRTVSRWETGTNLPDLSILVQISEYYDVEIKEILNGERKSENMDSELKETLLKVADYNEMEKQKAARVGNMSFVIMFLVCAIAIAVQMVVAGNLSFVIGETVTLIVGGMVYIIFMVRNGAWTNGASTKSTPKKDLAVGAICTGIFSMVFYLVSKGKEEPIHAVGGAACFFVVFCGVSYGFLRLLSYLSRKRADKIKDR